jgi:hypothetical protein
MRRFFSAFLAASFLFLSSAAKAEESMSITAKRVTVVAKSAAYGTVGGLVVGLASQVFEKKTKNIFMFGSLGLYAGILLGIYVVSTSSGPAPYEGPDTYDDFSMSKGVPGTLAYRREELKAAPDVQVNFFSVKF